MIQYWLGAQYTSSTLPYRHVLHKLVDDNLVQRKMITFGSRSKQEVPTMERTLILSYRHVS